MRKSLQAQLIVTVLLAEALLAAGVLLVGREAIHHQLLNGLDAAVNGRAISIAALVRYSEDEHPTLIFDKGLVAQPLDARFADPYEVFGPNGALIARSPSWPQELGSGLQLPEGFFHVSAGPTHLRGIRLSRVPILDQETGAPVSPAILTVVYATPTQAVYERLQSTMLSIAAAALLLLIATGIFAAWLLRRSLSPLRKLASEAERISAHQWSFETPREALEISELRPLAESLESMLKGLQQAFESQRDMVASAAHELKTPVAIQKSSLQLLLHHDRSAEEYKQGLQQVLRDTERLEDLLQRLLRLARAELTASGAGVRDLQWVPITDSCKEAIARLQPFAASRGVHLNFCCKGHSAVQADPDDLMVIWSNLLENAIRYSAQGQTVTLTVNGSNPGSATVSVADQGCGIAREQHSRIFERFYRGDQSRARDTGGYGLGLAIVKTLVEGYAGSVAVTSELGHGSTFEITLPHRSV